MEGQSGGFAGLSFSSFVYQEEDTEQMTIKMNDILFPNQSAFPSFAKETQQLYI